MMIRRIPKYLNKLNKLTDLKHNFILFYFLASNSVTEKIYF